MRIFAKRKSYAMVFDYKIYALQDHLDRMFNSAAMLRIELPYTKEEVSKPAFYDISDHNWMWGINVSVPMVNKNAYATPAGQLGSFSSYAYTA